MLWMGKGKEKHFTIVIGSPWESPHRDQYPNRPWRYAPPKEFSMVCTLRMAHTIWECLVEDRYADVGPGYGVPPATVYWILDDTGKVYPKDLHWGSHLEDE